MNSFSSILDRPATDFDRPPPLPVGQYLTVIAGLPRKDKSSKKGTDYVEFALKFIIAVDGDDGQPTVDPDALAEYEQLCKLADTTRNLTFYITEKSGYRFREFLEDDLEIDLNGKTLWEAAQEAVNSQVIVSIRQKPRDDGKGMFDEIAATAPAA